jgi:hypothetical protein
VRGPRMGWWPAKLSSSWASQTGGAVCLKLRCRSANVAVVQAPWLGGRVVARPYGQADQGPSGSYREILARVRRPDRPPAR